MSVRAMHSFQEQYRTNVEASGGQTEKDLKTAGPKDGNHSSGEMDRNKRIEDRYEGNFDDQMSGNGKIFFTNGNRYEGGIKNGKMHGKGILTYAEGNKYEKDPESGTANVIRYLGDKYQGDFAYGKKQGTGKVIFESSREIHESTFVNDRQVGPVKIYYLDNKKKLMMERMLENGKRVRATNAVLRTKL